MAMVAAQPAGVGPPPQQQQQQQQVGGAPMGMPAGQPGQQPQMMVGNGPAPQPVTRPMNPQAPSPSGPQDVSCPYNLPQKDMPGGMYNTGSRRTSNAVTQGQQEEEKTAKRGQRVRGVSFKQEYSRSAAMKRIGGSRARAPSMVSEPSKCMLPPQAKEDKGRITIVLDLDETLIYAREGPLFARPGLQELLDYLSEHCEPIVWTAGVKAYAQAVIRNIDKKNAFRHCVYRHKKWFSGCAGYNKDLTLLGRDMSKLLILENTPDCVRGNEENGIVVSDYEGTPEESEDPTLFAIRHMIRDMVNKVNGGMTVPEYITHSPLLSKMAVPTDLGDRLVVYCLDCVNFAESKETRVNRDLGK